jgi:post-segregation antitoxin (ccd killing protein)
MDKVTIEVAVDRDLLDEAERQGVDVQAEAERGLRRRLGRPKLTPAEIEEIKASVEGYNAHVERHGLFADKWRRF